LHQFIEELIVFGKVAIAQEQFAWLEVRAQLGSRSQRLAQLSVAPAGAASPTRKRRCSRMP
jgi:hypothetical protein